MWTNYFLTAWRNLLRNKVASLIKIAGLSLGLAVCLLILLYTKDEISYDRFHKNESRLFRIDQTMKMGAEPPGKMGITNPVLGEAFGKEIPEVASFVRVNDGLAVVKKGTDAFTEASHYVDDNFFSVFSFPLLYGSATEALKAPNAVVLSEDMARKYFGQPDAVGQTMEIKNSDAFELFTVTGVAKNAPQNSTIKFGLLLPFSYYKKRAGKQAARWAGGSLTTFLLLQPNAGVKAVERKMQAVFDANAKVEIAEGEKMMGGKISIALNLQPLTGIHLNKDNGVSNGLTDGSRPLYSYLLSGIAVFILLIACINFINMAVAQSLKRSKEIGIRKVMGGWRTQLIKQFLAESFLVSVIAFALAVVLAVLLLPSFNAIANKKLSLAYLADGWLYLSFFLLLLFTTFLAGFYPALVLSRFQPVKVLYGHSKLASKNAFTKGLMTVQFALSIFLVIGTLAVFSQLNFLRKKELGYDPNNLLVIGLPFGKDNDKLVQLFRTELGSRPSIESIASKNGGNNSMPVKTEGKQFAIDYSKIDENFLPTFKITLLAGRNFSPAFPSDTAQGAVVNESFAKQAGWTASEAIGKPIRFLEGTKELTVVGVVKDYHFTSLKQAIGPQLMVMEPARPPGELWVRIKPTDVPQTLALLQRTYKKLVPFQPYDYRFMSAITATHYDEEKKWGQIISLSAGLFVFVSCIGLFGLVLLTIGQRRKEIGIRKVLGAAAYRIVLLVSKDFLRLIAVAFVVAVPAGYWAVNKWLQSFPYRTEQRWWMYAVAGATVLCVSLLTMAYQSLKAATANPVKSLRTE